MSSSTGLEINNLDIVIPVRIDSTERKENLLTLLDYLQSFGFEHITVLEADTYSHINLSSYPNVKYIFVNDNNRAFWKNKYTNMLYKTSREFVAVWDTDIIVPYNQILEACKLLVQGRTLVLPYDGICLFLNKERSDIFRGHIDLKYASQHGLRLLGRPSVGGVYMINKTKFLSCGGENERFIGWGPEDAERIKRLEILGANIGRVKGQIYHLYHPIKREFSRNAEIIYRNNQREFLRICSLNKDQLNQDIQKWKKEV